MPLQLGEAGVEAEQAGGGPVVDADGQDARQQVEPVGQPGVAAAGARAQQGVGDERAAVVGQQLQGVLAGAPVPS